MAALTADVLMAHFGTPQKISVPATAATYWANSIVWALAAGYAHKTPGAGDRVLGVCVRQAIIGTTGDLLDVWVGGLFQFPSTSLDNSDIGDLVVFDSATVTDNPMDVLSLADNAIAASDCVVGRVVSYLNSKAIVQIGGVTGLVANATPAWA